MAEPIFAVVFIAGQHPFKFRQFGPEIDIQKITRVDMAREICGLLSKQANSGRLGTRG